jgi:hypothetical protein
MNELKIALRDVGDYYCYSFPFIDAGAWYLSDALRCFHPDDRLTAAGKILAMKPQDFKDWKGFERANPMLYPRKWLVDLFSSLSVPPTEYWHKAWHAARHGTCGLCEKKIVGSDRCMSEEVDGLRTFLTIYCKKCKNDPRAM